jgi:hypothetical protein
MSVKDIYTFKTRERTVCIDIQGAHPSGRVTWQEWTDFLTKDLAIDPDEVKEVGMHSLTRLLMVQTFSDLEYDNILSKLQGGVTWSNKDNVQVYGWSFKERQTTVKLLNVTLSMDLELLKTKISQYGRIVSWKKGKHPKFKKSFDNTITVRMMLDHGVKLPAFLPSEKLGEVIHLVSDAIDRACIRCLKSGHIAPHCRKPNKNFAYTKPNLVWQPLPENANSSPPLLTPSGPSYSQVAEGGVGGGLIPQDYAEIEPDPIRKLSDECIDMINHSDDHVPETQDGLEQPVFTQQVEDQSMTEDDVASSDNEIIGPTQAIEPEKTKTPKRNRSSPKEDRARSKSRKSRIRHHSISQIALALATEKRQGKPGATPPKPNNSRMSSVTSQDDV